MTETEDSKKRYQWLNIDDYKKNTSIKEFLLVKKHQNTEYNPIKMKNGNVLINSHNFINFIDETALDRQYIIKGQDKIKETLLFIQKEMENHFKKKNKKDIKILNQNLKSIFSNFYTFFGKIHDVSYTFTDIENIYRSIGEFIRNLEEGHHIEKYEEYKEKTNFKLNNLTKLKETRNTLIEHKIDDKRNKSVFIESDGDNTTCRVTINIILNGAEYIVYIQPLYDFCVLIQELFNLIDQKK